MHDDVPTLAALERLAASSDVRDRAFAASVLSLGRHEDRERVAMLHQRIRESARSHHSEVRARIRDGTLDERAFVARLCEAPLEIRDHLVEEILDVAYPPRHHEAALRRELLLQCPSGLAEILFMLEHAELRPGKTFVDLGSGVGKVVLLVALLTGARAYGVEIDPELVSHARSAAQSLGLHDAHFIEADMRTAPLPAADVYYMYSPFLRSTSVVSRLQAFAAERNILLFSQAVDLERVPWLRARNIASYWLETYEARALTPQSATARGA